MRSDLLLNSIRSLVLIIDTSQVVSTLMKVFNRASRSEALLEMEPFHESDSFFVLFRRFKGSVFKLVFEIKILDDFRDVALDLGREKEEARPEP